MAIDAKYGLSRRFFLKTLSLGGVVAAAPAMAAQAPSAAPTAQAMPKRVLGKTGVQVPVLALGGMFDTINNQLLLRQALNWGVNYWDTAEMYGNGLSEEGMGRYFGRNPEARKDVFLVTKLQTKEGNLEARLDKCLQRLQTNHVDLFFIHGISSFREMDEAVKGFATRMKQAGKIRYFGFSTHSNMEDCLLAASKADWIDATMISYNFRLMHEPKMGEALAACAKAGVGVVAMKTQGGGPVKSDSQAELDMAGRFLQRGFTDKQAKLKAVWDNPQIASLCSQMPNLTILSANVAAARDQTAMAAADWEVLRRYAQETRQDYCAGCGSLCSREVRVPVNDIMRCLMYLRDYGEEALARQVFGDLPAEVRNSLLTQDFSGAEQVCPRGLPVATLMREAATLLA